MPTITLDPFQFGAVGDGSTDDSAAFQAMFDQCTTDQQAYRIEFGPYDFYLATGVTLPNITDPVILAIDGCGARLRTDQAITMLSRVPTSQTNADTVISQYQIDIRNITFIGDGSTAGQTGLHLAAYYSPRTTELHFLALDYGFVGTFLLAGVHNQLRFSNCNHNHLLQTGAGVSALVWSGATTSNSASNVNTMMGCRSYGRSTTVAGYEAYGSDALVYLNCISEGGTTTIDYLFDNQGSTTVKRVSYLDCHCESPSADTNYRIRLTGGVAEITNPVMSYPAVFLDPSNTIQGLFKISNVAYLGGIPSSGPFIMQTDGVNSGGSNFAFYDAFSSGLLKNPAIWENGVLPDSLFILGPKGSGMGTDIWTNSTLNLSGGTIQWAGPLLPVLDDTYSLGVNVVRPSTGWFGTGGIDTKGPIRPAVDNTASNGTASNRWSVVYAATGSINTSDAREKTPVRKLTDDERAAARALVGEIGFFKFLGAIEAKGDENARWHAGSTVQRAIDVMEGHGLDPFAYGFICHDTWEASEDREAGELYSFRPTELLFFLMAGMAGG